MRKKKKEDQDAMTVYKATAVPIAKEQIILQGLANYTMKDFSAKIGCLLDSVSHQGLYKLTGINLSICHLMVV